MALPRAVKAGLLLLADKPVARVVLRAVDRVAARPVVVAKVAQPQERHWPKRAALRPCVAASHPAHRLHLRVLTA